MPTTPEAVHFLQDHGTLFAPGKAANAGGVAVSGLEMAQNAQHYGWKSTEVEEKLFNIMGSVHKACVSTAAACDQPGNYVVGANVAGFLKVAQAMLDQGVV